MEIWEDIEGYVGCYQASNLGNIKSLERKLNTRGGGSFIFKDKIVTQHNMKGYLYVHLSKKTKS